MNIIIISPHPDDDTIGCGGSIAKLAKEGHKITVVYVCTGDKGNPKIDGKALIKIRKKEAIEATKILGLKRSSLIFLKNLDGEIDFNKTKEDIRKIIVDKNPEVIYVPHPQDNLADHMISNKILTEIVKEQKNKKIKLLGYEVWTPIQRPTIIEDISDFIDLKIKAVKLHKSQTAIVPYHDAVKGLDRYRGIMVPKKKSKYGEAFEEL